MTFFTRLLVPLLMATAASSCSGTTQTCSGSASDCHSNRSAAEAANSGDEDYIHIGQSLHKYESIEVVAKLDRFIPNGAYIDYVDGGQSFSVSIFEIFEPAEHRGNKFHVNHAEVDEISAVWKEIGRSYLMLIHFKQVDPNSAVYVSPQLVTIIREVK